MRYRSILVCSTLHCLLGLLALAPLTTEGAFPAESPPPLLREFRGAWIATVANIDWPSSPGLTVQQQQSEMLALLDDAVRLRLNAVVFQVRPACDAIYPSKLEPWSEYLTGAQGQPPEPNYDPLAFAVEEAHRRGLQLHAWFNPYRAGHKTRKSKLADSHVSKRIPEAVVEYGKQLWLDPGNPQSVAHSVNVITDVVKRYDIDGVHFDDYFYPYPITDSDSEDGEQAKPIPFPDDNSWNAYVRETPEADRLTRDDWRRQNVNHLIKKVQEAIKREKSWVLFGVSPFGIWRPGHPEGIAGFDPHDKLYADARLWIREGWVDYFTPQLYWPIRSTGQSYPVLLDWWSDQNPYARHLWPGNYTSRVKVGDGEGWESREVVEQVRLTQAFKAASGNIHFSIKALSKNYDNVADALRAGPYAQPAVIPATPWLDTDASPPATPTTQRSQGQLRISAGDERPVWLWAIQSKSVQGWRTHLLPGEKTTYDLSSEQRGQSIAIRAIDRLGRESEPLVIDAE